jgi:hypothetical protein
MKITVEGEFITRRRTEEVSVSKDDMKSLASWPACPFKGKTPKDFVKYLPSLLSTMSEMPEEEREDAPPIADRLYEALASDSGNRVVSDVWTQAEDPIPTQILALDDDGEPIPGASVDNGTEYM